MICTFEVKDMVAKQIHLFSTEIRRKHDSTLLMNGFTISHYFFPTVGSSWKEDVERRI